MIQSVFLTLLFIHDSGDNNAYLKPDTLPWYIQGHRICLTSSYLE